MAKDYSLQDFTDVLEDLFSIIEASTTRWNPRTSTEADPGVVILKIIALLEDKFNMKLNMSEAQAYLDSVTDRQYAFDLLMMLGYIMKSARSSTGTIALSKIEGAWQNLSEKPTEIPIFTTVTNVAKSVNFFTTKTVTIAQDAKASTLVTVQEGSPFQITKEGVSYFSLKDVDEEGKLFLGVTGLAQNGVFIGTRYFNELLEDYSVIYDWNYVEFSLLPLSGKQFSVETDTSGEMYVQFPDDFETIIAGTTFEVWGTFTKGAAGNITKGTLSVIDNPTLKNLFAIDQSQDFYTGLDTETIQQATEQYYRTKDVCNTLVTAADYAVAIEQYLTQNFQRLYSKAFVDTALTRQKKYVRRWYDQRYIAIVPDDTTPTNQVDVLALTYSDDYAKGFAKADLSATESPTSINTLSAYISDNAALGIDLQPSEKNRILATVTPKMVIRVSNYSEAAVSALKTKIRNYFYTTYRPENIQPGQPLSHQKIVSDIQALSPDIQSVSLAELSYQVYKERQEVDGQTSPMSEADKQAIVGQAIREGQIPAFKFYNRPNTRSKAATIYSLSSDEVFNPVPWGINDTIYMLEEGKSVSPVVTDLITSKIISRQDMVSGETNTNNRQIALNPNHVLQIRRKLHRPTTDYGFGLQYAFFTDTNPVVNTPIVVTVNARLGEGTKLAKGADPNGAKLEDTTVAIVVTSQDYANITPPVSCWVRPPNGEWSGTTEEVSSFTAGTMYALAQDLLVKEGGTLRLAKGSVIQKGSTIPPMSQINNAPYSTFRIKTTEEYQLTDSDILFITRASDSAIVDTIKAGTWIKPTGVDIISNGPTKSATTIVQNQILQSSQTISKLEDDSSIVTTDFKYLLSLNNKSGTFDLPIDGYMLEEGEAFVYADQNLTEYILLGPGTILKPADEAVISTTLVVSPVANVTEAGEEYFNPLTFEIRAQSCELTTYLSPLSDSKILRHDMYKTDSMRPKYFPMKWMNLGEGNVNYTVSVWSVEKEKELASFSGPTYDVRLVAKIETDEKGLARIYAPIQFTLRTDTSSSLPYIGTEETATLTLLSSLPFVSVITNSATLVAITSTMTDKEKEEAQERNKAILAAAPTLLPAGIAAGFGRASIPLPTTIYDPLLINQDAETIEIIVNDTLPPNGIAPSFNYLRAGLVPSTSGVTQILAMFSVEYPTDSSTKTTGITLSGNANAPVYVYNPGKDPVPVSVTSRASGKGGIVVSLPLTGSEGASATTITFNIPSDTPIGTKIKLYNLSYVTSLSDEALYVKDSKGQLISKDSPDYFNPATSEEVNAFLAQVADELIDWLNIPDEALANPTNSDSYFVSTHPLNKLTMPYIVVDQKEIKIIRS